MSVITWVHPNDCDPPHGLDLTAPHDYEKVNMLVEAFSTYGFDKSKSALVGYPREGRVQLLSGTHRHEAAKRAGIALPVMFWLRSAIEESWGELDDWRKVMQDIPVAALETWTREDVERHRVRVGAL
jgi:hypothetical protein